MAEAVDAAVAAPCRLLPRVAAPNGELGELVAAARTPTGVRVFQREGFWDGRGAEAGRAALPPGAAVAFGGDGYVVATERALVRYDREMGGRRVVRSLPGHACDPQLLALPTGLVLLYRRAPRSGCNSETAQGPVLLQRLSPVGAPDGPPVQIGAGDAERAQVASLRARWDAGRIVVHTVSPSGAETDTVLAPDGRELAQVPGGGVVCARAGCVRLAGRNAAGGSVDGLLRAEIVGGGGSFALPLAVADVLDAAVQGDRVLLRFSTGGAVGDDAANLAVLDLRRRLLLPLFDTALRTTVLSWYEPGAGASARLMTTARGFAVVGFDVATGAFRRDVECAR